MSSRESDASQRVVGTSKETSRLVVLSLPSDLDTSGLSAHFSTLDLPMTDVKVLRKKDGTSRRMAFIGYSSVGDAVKAKEWFDNTWLRGSRIKVDFALPVSNDKLQSRKRARSPHSSGSQATDSGQDATRLDQIASSEISRSIPNLESGRPDNVTAELSDAEYLARRKRRNLGDEDSAGTSPSSLNQNAMVSHHTNHDAPAKNRLFLRNLPFDTTESTIRDAFAAYGPIEQIHIPGYGKQARGLAYVTYARSADALAALEALDGHGFNGRLLHIMIAQGQSAHTGIGSQPSGPSMSSYKQTKAAELQLDADKPFNWASLYMNSDAVLNSLAKRLGLPKADLLAPEVSGAAAKLALAETMLLKETREFFESHGVRFDAKDRTAERSSNILLLKNLPSGTNANTIRGLLAPYGLLKHLLIPPSGLVAIVQFEDPQSAASAAKNVAYCKIGNSIVYVERASSQFVISEGIADVLKQEPGFSEREPNAQVNSQCLFVQNFPRGTDAKALQDLFVSRTGFRSLKLVRNDSKGEYAFVTFNGAEPASKAYEEMDGQLFAGRRLNIARSTDRQAAKPAYDSLESESNGSATCKLIVKNLPFEASLADLRTILSPYGKLSSLRIPRKADQSPRGFAFAHFASPAQAKMALENLKHTHLLGRHLIIEPANERETL